MEHFRGGTDMKKILKSFHFKFISLDKCHWWSSNTLPVPLFYSRKDWRCEVDQSPDPGTSSGPARLLYTQ